LSRRLLKTLEVLQVIKVKLLHNYATLPKQGTPGSAGFDLYATENHTIWPGARVKMPTGVALEIPPGYAGFIWPRSGMAVKHGFDTHAGLIDSDYRGEISVAGMNHGDRAIEIRRGERVAQIVFSPVSTLLEMVTELEDPETRQGGFGSTGI
jgi:dUTP pyrophosphatase